MARVMFILLCCIAFASAVSGAYGAQKPSGHHQHHPAPAQQQHHHPAPVHTQPHVKHESVHHGHYAKVHYPTEPVVAHPKVPEKHGHHQASSHQPNKGYHH